MRSITHKNHVERGMTPVLLCVAIVLVSLFGSSVVAQNVMTGQPKRA